MSKAILPEALEGLRTPLTAIRPDPANPNKHPKRQVDQIALSFQEFGQDQPIVVDRKGVIAKGEGRFLAAQALGWEDAAVLFVDDDELRRIRRNIADNQTAKLAEMDEAALLALAQAQEQPVAGFDEQAMKELLAAVGAGVDADESGPGNDPAAQLNRAEQLRDQWQTERGQIW